MRSSVNRWVPLAALVFLPACSVVGGKPAESLPAAPATGPAADYPVVVGEPFTIGALTYTPEDSLNYDAVGYAAVSDIPDNRVWAAHKTLPLPSYAEITDLETGKTILVRVEERGPMVNERVLELSQGAALQLGVVPDVTTPVRVRRVNPPESDRAMLRSGGQAPPRMDTPEPLLKVLKRKLNEKEPLAAPATSSEPVAPVSSARVPTPVQEYVASQAQPATAAPSKPAPAATAGDLVVQVAAFSSRQRAEKAAAALGAFVTRPGSYWYVRLGPFASQSEAQAALAKARQAGYGDARIQTTD